MAVGGGFTGGTLSPVAGGTVRPLGDLERGEKNYEVKNSVLVKRVDSSHLIKGTF